MTSMYLEEYGKRLSKEFMSLSELLSHSRFSFIKENNNYDKLLGIQNVYTPFVINGDAIGLDPYFDAINIDKILMRSKSICVLFNWEILNYSVNKIPGNLVNMKEFTYYADSDIDESIGYFIKYRYNLKKLTIKRFKDSKTNFILDNKEIFNEMKMKKFDFIIGNPPFTNNMDLSILNSIKELCNEVCFIHPSTFLIKNGERQSDVYKKHVESKSLEKLVLFWGNQMFGINLFVPLCISYWNSDYNCNMVSVFDNAFSKCTYKIDIKDVSVFGKNVHFKNEIFEIIKKYKNNTFGDHMLSYPERPSNYSIKVSIVRGHAPKNENDGHAYYDDFFTMLCETKKIKEKNYINSSFEWNDPKKSHGMQPSIFSFKSENEREMFVKICKTKICRIFFAYYKNNNNTYVLKNIPWIDVNQEWDDKKLCKKFNISDDLWNFINSFIPDYYEDYKSGF